MRSNPSITDVARNFADYINRVAFLGERFTLMRRGKPVAELRPVPAGRRLGELAALLASLPGLSAADSSSIAEHLEVNRNQLNKQPLHDPWAS